MYLIQRAGYGYHLTFGGFVDGDEMQGWLEESQRELAEAPDTFGVVVDMRTLMPLHPDAQQLMERGQALYRQAGMERSAVILNHPVTTIQFQRLAQQSGIYEWERYIDASSDPEWEKMALNWVQRGQEPG